MADPDFMADLAEQRETALNIALGKDPAVAKLFTFYEFLGLCLMSKYEFKKALLLAGYPHSGKSTLLNIVRKFLGERNCVSVPLSKMDSNNNKFASARLDGKLANIIEEVGIFNVKSLDAFKALTSGSPIDVEKKRLDGYDMENFAKCFLAANELPKIPPAIFESTMDRIVGVECTNKFLATEKTTKSELQHKDFKPTEMSGLLNIAIAGLERLLETGGKFSSYDESETAALWNKYCNITADSPIKTFINTYCILTGNHKDRISRKDFYSAYLKYSEDKNKISERDFSHKISLYSEEILVYPENGGAPRKTGEYNKIGQKTIDVRYWTGIAMNPSLALANPMESDKPELNTNQEE